MTFQSIPQSNIHFQPFCLTCREVAAAKCYNEGHPRRVGPEAPKSPKTRIRKDGTGAGYYIEVWINNRWYLKQWTAGLKRDALRAEAELRKELANKQA